MVTQVLNLIFGSKNDREIKAIRPIVTQINELEAGLTPLSNEALADKTQDFKKRLAAGQTLDDILPEAFAVCREMSRRKLNMRHFDVQLIGGMILHEGRIAARQGVRRAVIADAAGDEPYLGDGPLADHQLQDEGQAGVRWQHIGRGQVEVRIERHQLLE